MRLLKTVLLILGIVLLVSGIATLVFSGFMGVIAYAPLIALGLLCLYLRKKIR